MKDEGLVSHLACCDLDAGKLKELLSWARVCEMIDLSDFFLIVVKGINC